MPGPSTPASSKHYGIKAKNMEVHAYAEPEHGDKALDLMRKVDASTADIQRRCRQAVAAHHSDQRVARPRHEPVDGIGQVVMGLGCYAVRGFP